MSDTPRTDQIAMSEGSGRETVPSTFARQLERELAFVRKELSEAREMEMMKAQQCTAERQRASAAERDLAKAVRATKADGWDD